MNVPTIAVVFGRKKSKDNKPLSIEIRLTVNRKVKYVSTGVKVRPKEWREGYVVNRYDSDILNERISVIRRSVEELVNNSIAHHETLDLTKLKMIKSINSDNESFISFIEQRSRKRVVRDSTRERYDVFLRKFKTYGKIKSFEDITVEGIKDFNE